MDGVSGVNNNNFAARNEPRGNEIALDPSMRQRVEDNNASGVKKKDAKGVHECQTCQNRRYVDGSDDPGVSFKSPTKLTPALAATAVFSHEREHYVREEENARNEGREVLSNDIRIFTDVCPECGKTYVSGGETTTVTRRKAEQAKFAKDFYDKSADAALGKQIDAKG